MSMNLAGPDTSCFYRCRRHFAGGSCPDPAFINRYALESRVEAITFVVLGRRREMSEAPLRKARKRADAAHRSLATYRDSPHILNAL
jgi:hypothetical protein